MESSILGSSRPAYGPVAESDRLLAVLAHLLTLVTSFIAPLVIYLLKRNESYYVTDHARESLNFQLTLIIAYVVAFFLMFLVIGILLLPLIGLVHMILVIVATVRAADNQLYRYPFTIRFLR